ncbi:MAG: hypothetical protein ABT02_21325 [Comamonadaceae bacterium SCN 68-20]|nr:MAG: hypothetical protein ABT02_21325 [Comamonadaceae bacterium SCN 68-20]
MVAVRWLMRTTVPTTVLRYLSSKATFSPQRKSLREGLSGVDAAGCGCGGAAAGGGGSTAAYGSFHSRRVPASCSVTCASFKATTLPLRIWPSR